MGVIRSDHQFPYHVAQELCDKFPVVAGCGTAATALVIVADAARAVHN